MNEQNEEKKTKAPFSTYRIGQKNESKQNLFFDFKEPNRLRKTIGGNRQNGPIIHDVLNTTRKTTFSHIS